MLFQNKVKLIFLFSFLYSLLGHSQYCTPNFADPSQLYIGRVQLNSLDVSQTFVSPSNSYSDLTVNNTSLTQGTTYTISIYSFRVDSWRSAGYGIWIDYNNDGDFDDANEQIGTISTTTDSVVNYTFTVPAGVSLGSKRLRINMVNWYIPHHCAIDGTNFGETEDYTVTIVAPANPIAMSDYLSVIANSTSGISNQINVSLNDVIGSDGSDGDDYTTIPSPLTTTQGGTVSEISDGVFQYIPLADYIGTDNFNYSICDAAGDCVTSTVYITVGLGACVPINQSQGTHFISNVNLIGETTTINNTSGDDGGYANYTNIPAADLYIGSTYPLTITGNPSLNSSNHHSGWAAYIDYNHDGDFSDVDENIYDSNGEVTTYPFLPINFTVSASALEGNTIMRVGTRRYWSSNNPCGNSDGQPEEFEDYEIIISEIPTTVQNIKITGNLNTIINGSTTTQVTDFTNFGIQDINSGTKLRTFTIENNGSLDLTLGNVPVSFLVGSSSAFTIISQPAPNTILTSGNSTTFTIAFNPATIGTFNATIVIASDDPDENPFTFLIEAEGSQTYLDTDGDGVTDNIDIDDDNDGITDSNEQTNCLSNSLAVVVETLFLFEDFGSGLNRARIDDRTPGVNTTYCFEDGTTAMAVDECDSDSNLGDGKYTVHYSISNGVAPNDVSNTGTDLAFWADGAWTITNDHTPGDTNGRMAIFNASYTPGVFYETQITGILPGVPITYSFWALNIDNLDANFSASALPRILPNITVNFYSTDYSTLLATYNTGDISRCTAAGNTCLQSEWQQFLTSIILPVNEFVIQFVNNAPGGNGNDLALDDIRITQTLCDTDGDGVADIFDLDNDNDGIPNIVEAAMISNPDPDEDSTTAGPTWIDANNNGMHDSFEGLTPNDFDGDGVSNHLDLDSDNDGIFDALEFDGLGDLDITGNGIGDGNDANTGIDSDAFDGDGILDTADSNDNDIDGIDHGTNGYLGAIDTDGDGMPDYLDVYNDITGVYDIDTTYYSSLDANNDGVIDNTVDADSDGVMDVFDTDDLHYGSPRDLNDKFALYFDGRNDYVEDSGDIILGLNQATIMAWIKLDPTFSNEGVVVGQENFYLKISNTKIFEASLNGTNYTLSGAVNILPTNKWVHIAGVFDGTNSLLKLYVNGELKIIESVGNTINTSTNKLFRIGSLPASINSNFFLGEIDEVRVFNQALSDDQLQKIVYQELNNTNFAQGSIIPLNVPSLNASSLIRYYRMDTFKDDIVDDLVNPGVDLVTGAKLYNIKNIYVQTAPLPYETTSDGDWSNSTTWKYGQYWDIDAVTRPWSIVHIKNNINTTSSHENSGLIVDNGNVLNMIGDLALTTNWYLKLDGKIDLQNESQLIQTFGSILDVTSEGSVERDQQGTADNFTYNYFSSPVTPVNTTINNGTYTIGAVLKDGTNPASPQNINFQNPYIAADGAPTTPITLSNYWMWKFTNLPSLYPNWIQIRHNGNLNAGEGFTMKGPNTGNILQDQNYVFEGKPNNGDIDLSITSNNIYLVGNPYPSALNARQFILDNPDITGTLKFWEHWGGGSHVLAEYQGGYALLNLSGSVVNASYGINDPLVGTGGTPTKLPQPSIPVAQGFFVEAINDGIVHFNNGQREFVTETSGNSIFVRSATNSTTSNYIDDRMKIRLGYQSPGGIHRQLLVTVDENTTFEYDNRYDGKNIDTQFDDLNWKIGQEKYIIQGVPSLDANVVLPLQVKTRDTGLATFSIEDLENIPVNKEIYLKDNLLGIIHNIKTNNYTTIVEAGTFDNRFEIIFQNPTLMNDDFQIEDVTMFFNDENDWLQINNSENKFISNIKLFNVIGQEMMQKELNSTETTIKVPINLAKGVYIVQLKAENKIMIKKIIIQ